MHQWSRRALLVSVVAASGARFVAHAAAQTDAPQAGGGGVAPFGYPDVVKRARDLAAAPYDAAIPALPDGLANLDFDAWRDIRFKSEKPLLGGQNGNFRLELFSPRPSLINQLLQCMVSTDTSPSKMEYLTRKYHHYSVLAQSLVRPQQLWHIFLPW